MSKRDRVRGGGGEGKEVKRDRKGVEGNLKENRGGADGKETQ